MSRPRQVVIVGRDAPLWLSAAAIRTALAAVGVEVTAIELPSRLGQASTYTTLPAIQALHTKLGLNEADLLRTTGGSFSLGWNIRREQAEPFFIAHGSYGAEIDHRDFFPYWVKAHRFGLQVALEQFSPTAMAARHGRMLAPDRQIERFGRTDYGYHLPAIPYAAMLKSLAIGRGVVAHHANTLSVERDPSSGWIKEVRLGTGTSVSGDLFVDASGGEAVLIGDALGVSTEDWRSFFPFDCVLTGRGKRHTPIPPYAELSLGAQSWTGFQARQHGTYIIHACSSAEERPSQARMTALGFEHHDLTVGSNVPGIRTHAWDRNCVAIGAAACALDPLFDLELHATQLSVVHLLSLFPATIAAGPEPTEYNRATRSHFERLRDFQAALYLLAGYSTAAPATVIQKLDIFRARGAFAPLEDETFAPDQWRALFVGMGIMPDSWPPAIDNTSPESMKASFRNILGFVRDTVLQQPAHEDFLANTQA